jgi:hypothetical protein
VDKKHESPMVNMSQSFIVSIHRTLKLENRNWKFGLHVFVLLMNAVNLGPSFSTIALNGYH